MAAVSWLRLVWWDRHGRHSFLCADATATLTAAAGNEGRIEAASKSGESKRRFSRLRSPGGHASYGEARRSGRAKVGGLSTTARKRDALPALPSLMRPRESERIPTTGN
jgi:hypothetical protein